MNKIVICNKKKHIILRWITLCKGDDESSILELVVDI